MVIHLLGREEKNMQKTYVIAEIGGNFTDYQTAKLLIDHAKEAGADAVKLQTYRANTISSKQAMFDMENTGIVSQAEYFKKFAHVSWIYAGGIR